MAYDYENDCIVDYMREHRAEAELVLVGVSDAGSGTRRIEVAKVGGGTLGKTYPAGEQWIVNSYVGGELTESVKISPETARTHMKVIAAAAAAWFGV